MNMEKEDVYRKVGDSVALTCFIPMQIHLSTSNSNPSSAPSQFSDSGGGHENATKVSHDNEWTPDMCRTEQMWTPSNIQSQTEEHLFSCPICNQSFLNKWRMLLHHKATHGHGVEQAPRINKRWIRQQALKADGWMQNEELGGDHPTSEVIITSEAEDQTVENQWAQLKASRRDCSVTETGDDSSYCEFFISVEDAETSDLNEFNIDIMTEEILVSRIKGFNTSSGKLTFVYKCHLCDKMYVSIDTLHYHLLDHIKTLEVDDSHVCHICGELLNTKSDLEVHLDDHSAMDNKLGDKPKTVSRENECSVKSDDYGDLLSETPYCMTHVDLAQPVLEEEESITVKDKRRRSRILKCKICSKTFNRSYLLITHLRTHNGTKQKCFCCHCGKGFSEQITLIRHTTSCHPSSFKDDKSSKKKRKKTAKNKKRNKKEKVMSKDVLTPDEAIDEDSSQEVTVLKIIKKNKRPNRLKCKLCPKTFDCSSSLKQHICNRNGTKKCYCTHCGLGFSRHRKLRHHISRLHSDVTLNKKNNQK